MKHHWLGLPQDIRRWIIRSYMARHGEILYGRPPEQIDADPRVQELLREFDRQQPKFDTKTQGVKKLKPARRKRHKSKPKKDWASEAFSALDAVPKEKAKGVGYSHRRYSKRNAAIRRYLETGDSEAIEEI